MDKAMAKNSTGKKNNATQKKNQVPKQTPTETPPVSGMRRLGQEVAALLLVGLAVFLLLALWSWTLRDPQDVLEIFRAPLVANWGGKAGALVGRCLFGFLGLAAFWVPFFLIGLAWQSYREGLEHLAGRQVLAALGVIFASTGLLSLIHPHLSWGEWGFFTGGWLGRVLAGGLRAVLNPLGAGLLLGVALLAGLMGTTRLSVVGLAAYLVNLGRRALEARRRPAAAEAPAPQPGREAPPPVITRTGTVPPEPLVPPAEPEPAGPPPAPLRPRRAKAAGGKFQLPPLDLLDPPKPWDHQVRNGQMVAQADKLEDTLRQIGRAHV